MSNQAELLGRLHNVAFFVAAHKRGHFEPTVKWCSKIYSGQGVEYHPERVRGLTYMKQPESFGEMMNFLRALT